MADHRQKLGEGRELEMFATTPATMAAGQIAQAATDFEEYWAEVSDTIPDSVIQPNLDAAGFMTSIAKAIYEDRLVILDAPREGQGIILTPRGQSWKEIEGND